MLTTLTYAGILLAAIVEGEIAYIGAAALVAQGQLSPLGVLTAGALGAAIGDQAYFYMFRGRLPRWVARYPSLEQKTRPLVSRVRRHDALMVLLIRFAPGMRIALAAACAWVDVSPLKFSVLNLVSALVSGDRAAGARRMAGADVSRAVRARRLEGRAPHRRRGVRTFQGAGVVRASGHGTARGELTPTLSEETSNGGYRKIWHPRRSGDPRDYPGVP